ncbi:MAG: metalloregulator ArsR/SmtB family transcription factor [Halobacteriales archaeon]|nr:metalloregulator ArsR/SmtB family transcription factor [Halobacteriales archaeon]
MPRAVRTRKADPRDAVFKALADPTRRAILVALGGGERRVADVAARFPVSRPAVSKHLAILKRAGLVEMRKQGRDNLYRIVPATLRAAAGYVQDVEGFWEERISLLSNHLTPTNRGYSLFGENH